MNINKISIVDAKISVIGFTPKTDPRPWTAEVKNGFLSYRKQSRQNLSF